MTYLSITINSSSDFVEALACGSAWEKRMRVLQVETPLGVVWEVVRFSVPQGREVVGLFVTSVSLHEGDPSMRILLAFLT